MSPAMGHEQNLAKTFHSYLHSVETLNKDPCAKVHIWIKTSQLKTDKNINQNSYQGKSFFS